MDSGLSPQSAVANVRQAVDDESAVAVVDEGTGVDASWRIAADADLPLGITYQGGVGLVDPQRRPNVFRIAPTDHGLAFRLAEYMIPKGLKIALLVDDSGYGQEGEKALAQAFRDQESVVARIEVPAAATDVAPQVLRAKRAGATALLVWAQPGVITATITAARSAGWDVPIYAPPSGADDHPAGALGPSGLGRRPDVRVRSDDLGGGLHAVLHVRSQLRGGLRTAADRREDAAGEEVIQPPEYAMYSFDFVRLLATAMETAGAVRGERLIKELNEVTIAGANGDERGFNPMNHEGVIDDDVYFARFRDMTFAPSRTTCSRRRCRTSSRRGEAPRAGARRCRGRAGADGSAAPPLRLVELPGVEALPRDAAAGAAAAAARRDAEAARDGLARNRVRVGIDGDGSPHESRSRQRLEVRALGDYTFFIPAPAITVTAGARERVAARLRQNQILWQGFSPRRRVLAASAQLRLQDSAPGLPIRLHIAGARPSRAVRARDHDRERDRCALEHVRRRPGRGRRRGGARFPPRRTGRAYRGEGDPRPRRGAADSRSMRAGLRSEAFAERLCSTRRRCRRAIWRRRPLQAACSAAGLPQVSALARRGSPAAPSIRLVAQPFIDAALPPASTRSFADLQRVSLRYARARQYQSFLANPDSIGPSETTYVYETATAEPAPRPANEPSDDAALPAAIVLGGLALLAFGLVVVWAHS